MSKIEIVVLDPHDVYVPGQTVRGHVMLNLNHCTHVQRKMSFILFFNFHKFTLISNMHTWQTDQNQQ